MNISEIIEELERNPSEGVQLSKRGTVNSTWLLYKKDGFYYYFDINQKTEFVDNYKYTREELIKEFPRSFFEIDDFTN
jgi:hypothetical protein